MADVGLKQRDAAAPAIEVPRATNADVVVQRAGAVLGENADVSDLRVGAVAQGEVDDAVAAAERDGRFCPLLGEHAEPVSLPSGEDHRDDTFHGASLPADGSRRWLGAASRPRSVRKICR